MNRLPRSTRPFVIAAALFILGLQYPVLHAALNPPVEPEPPHPLTLGEQALRRGAFYQAEISFRQALDDPETKARALGRLGLLALLRGDQEEAAWRLAAVTQASPSDADSWAYLGLALARQDNRPAAMAAWEEALAQPGPTFLALGLRGEEHYRHGEMAEAAADFAALLDQQAPADWQGWAHLRLAILEALSTPVSAQSRLEQAQKESPWTGEGWFPSAELLYNLPAGERSRRAKELEGLSASLSFAPKAARAVAFGQVLLAQLDAAGAAYVLETAAKLAPQDTRALAYLGYARFSLGQEQQGLDDLHAALGLAPDDPLTHHLLGRAYLTQKDALAARSELEQALELSPGVPAVLLDLSLTYQQTGDYQEAAFYLDMAAAHAIGTTEELVYGALRARFYLTSGWSLCEQGFAAAEALVRLGPEWAEALRIQGGILARCGQSREAIVVLDRAIRLDWTSAEAYDTLGLAHLALGNSAAARRAFFQAANREPGSLWSRHARTWLEEH